MGARIPESREDDLFGDLGAVFGIAYGFQPRLHATRFNDTSPRETMRRNKTDRDVVLGVPELLLDELHIRARALLRRVERADVRRERLEERPEGLGRGARRVCGDEPGGPGSGD